MRNFNTYTIYKAVFSPTYGTSHAASLLAEQLEWNIPCENVKKLNLTTPQERAREYFFGSNDLVIVACPVYGGQMPPVEKLFENLHGNQTPCILVACYGNRNYDDTLAQMQKVMARQDFICVGALACIIPHVFSDKVGAGRPNVDDLSKIAAFANTLKRKFEVDTFEQIQVPGNPDPEVKPRKDIPKALDNEKCTKCGLCSVSCPVGAINPVSLEIDTSKCINCMRCAFVCPEKARTFQADGAKQMLETNCMEPKEIEFFL